MGLLVCALGYGEFGRLGSAFAGESEALFLPIGYKDVWWGAPIASVLALRGGLEEQADLEQDVVHYLEDMESSHRGGPIRARYTFWRGRLMALGLWYPEAYTGQLPRDVVRQFSHRWGPVDEEVYGEGSARNTPVAWIWRSPVSEITLHWEPSTQEFRQSRRSVILSAAMVQAKEQRQVEARSSALQGLVGED